MVEVVNEIVKEASSVLEIIRNVMWLRGRGCDEAV